MEPELEPKLEGAVPPKRAVEAIEPELEPTTEADCEPELAPKLEETGVIWLTVDAIEPELESKLELELESKGKETGPFTRAFEAVDP